MKFIDPHIHCVSRTTDDYKFMQRCGVIGVSEPAFWAGFDRSSAGSFPGFFLHLLEGGRQTAPVDGSETLWWGCRKLQKGAGRWSSRERVQRVAPVLSR